MFRKFKKDMQARGMCKLEECASQEDMQADQRKLK